MKALTDIILEVVKNKHPEDIKKLVQLVQEQSETATKEKILKKIKELQKKNILILKEPTHISPDSLGRYLSLKISLWFWITIGLTLLTFISVLVFPESGTLLSYARYFFGFIFVAFLPGYCLTETIFPKRTTIDEIERIAFSIGLSFTLTALVGLFLSFSPFGLTLFSSLLTLGFIVIGLSIVALIRKFSALST